MVCANEELFVTLWLKDADDILLQTLAAHPQLLQRPIVRFHHRPVISRPSELINTILH